ncbi:MAG: DUF4038 domain-containing protein [Armatimonadetes bacterium]|nr:DUF4038 domain-containing protein [Armatimonadota bacterium]
MPESAPLPDRPIAFPVRLSDNRRYFIDSAGEPVFWLGTTQWQIFRDHSLSEASAILERSRAHGFTFAQAMLLGVGDGMLPNLYGELPWIGGDPLQPNEAYFRHADKVLEAARKADIAVVLTVYHQLNRKSITPENARLWARWLARRYGDQPHVIWSLCPEAQSFEIPVLRELAAGLREGASGPVLITCHPDPSPASSGFLREEDWLDIHAIQTWRDVSLIAPMVSELYASEPVRPVVMAEGAYEAGEEYGFDVTPLWVRRQAYYSYMTGGHYGYGHNDSWRMRPDWRAALDAPGAVQMGILKRVFQGLPEWWRLVPAPALLAVTLDKGSPIRQLAASHPEGWWFLVYLAEPSPVALRLEQRAAGPLSTDWIDPSTGESLPVGILDEPGTHVFPSSPPGWEDALLRLKVIG